jgi:hypothetical protein
MKSPVPWNGQCFVHLYSNDRDDRYDLDPGGPDAGYLLHQRSTGSWLASLRGVKATVSRGADEPAWKVDDRDIARRALDAALTSLRARVATDQKWLEMIDEEIGT